MSYEKTVWAGEGTLAREQEYNYHWCYERGIITKAWLDVYAATGDRRFYDAAKANADQYVTADGEILTYEPDKYNLDMICMGRTALRLFKATGEAKYEKACRRLIEQIKGQPTTAEGGFWHKKLYPQQMWLDGIYMACPFLTEFAVTFGEMQWADLAAKQMTLIFDRTRLESGLHAHAWDSARAQKWADPQTGLSPHVWGRAMGWFVMAHADVLAVLPESHPAYARLSLQMKSLLHAVMAARGTDKHAEARAVALNPHHVERIRRVAHHTLVCIHNGDVVPFAHKLLGQRMADLAAAHNNDAQALHLLLRRFGLHGFLPPPSSLVFRRDGTMFSSLLYRLYPALSMCGVFLLGFLAVGQPEWLDAPAGSAYNEDKKPVSRRRGRAEYKFRFG